MKAPHLRKPHIGLAADRLHPKADNPREVAFAKLWSYENTPGPTRTPILASLVGKDFTERDAQVAATVIQWLGSNVGISFLRVAIVNEPLIKRSLNY